MSEEPGHTLRIERTFAAPAEDVFDAWTSAEVMRRWFHCFPDWDTPEAEVDLRVGGTVRVVMGKPDGTRSGMYGEYTVIERPRRLEMRWTFEEDPDHEQRLELTFAESDGSTTVVLVNRAIPTDPRRDAQRIGWAGCLAELERMLLG